jgi:membrane protease subunit HflK
MPWNNSGPGDGSDGPSPWGTPGGGNGKRPGGRPQGPWGGGPRGPSPRDIEELIARLQGFLRGLLPPGFGGGRGPRAPGRGFGGGRAALLILIVVVALWGSTGFYRVEPDELGVVLRFGAYNRTAPPGLNWHFPWPVESVMLPAVTRINRIEIGYRSAAETGRGENNSQVPITNVPAESLMLTGDENIIDIHFTVFWRISNVTDFLFKTRNPVYTVKSVAESVMREVIGSTPIQPALTNARAKIEESVKSGVQAVMDNYGSGVEVTQIQLQKVDPPAAVIESFRDVQRANTDADTMRNQAEGYHNDIVPRARGNAAAIVAEANGARQASVATATGQSQRFLSVLKAYDAAKDVTMQRLYLETMQEILSKTPTVILDKSLQGLLPLLPLNGGSPALASPPASNPPASGGATR